MSDWDGGLVQESGMTAARYQHRHLGSGCWKDQAEGRTVSWTLTAIVLAAGSLPASADCAESESDGSILL